MRTNPQRVETLQAYQDRSQATRRLKEEVAALKLTNEKKWFKEDCFEQTTWSFQRFKENADQFYIEGIYGEKRPKLMPCYSEPAMWSKVLSSNRLQDGYREKAKCVWTLEDTS